MPSDGLVETGPQAIPVQALRQVELEAARSLGDGRAAVRLAAEGLRRLLGGPGRRGRGRGLHALLRAVASSRSQGDKFGCVFFSRLEVLP